MSKLEKENANALEVSNEEKGNGNGNAENVVKTVTAESIGADLRAGLITVEEATRAFIDLSKRLEAEIKTAKASKTGNRTVKKVTRIEVLAYLLYLLRETEEKSFNGEKIPEEGTEEFLTFSDTLYRKFNPTKAENLKEAKTLYSFAVNTLKGFNSDSRIPEELKNLNKENEVTGS